MNLPKDLLIIDFETLGTEPEKHDAIQWAALLLDQNTLEEKARFSTFIRPERFDRSNPDTYSEAALTVNGFTIEKIEQLKTTASPLPEVLADFERAIFGDDTLTQGKSYGNSVMIAGQNVSFDMGFLRDILGRLNLSRDRYGYHSIDLASQCFMAQTCFGMEMKGGKTNLDAQIEYFGFTRSSEHDAMEDVLITANLFRIYFSTFSKIHDSMGERDFFNEARENFPAVIGGKHQKRRCL